MASLFLKWLIMAKLQKNRTLNHIALNITEFELNIFIFTQKGNGMPIIF